jgi:osmotically-inducible protein OsmY
MKSLRPNQSLLHPIKHILTIVILATASMLQGCFPLAATGVGVTALALSDRRATGIQIEDQNIEFKVNRLMRERFPDIHINTTSFNFSIILSGEALNDQMIKEIGEAAKTVSNVRNVTNEIIVAGNSGATARGNDVLITGNVRARLINNGVVSPSHVKVFTEAGTTFLMGIVTKEEGDAAAEIARTTKGVSRVVKAFEYIDQAPK